MKKKKVQSSDSSDSSLSSQKGEETKLHDFGSWYDIPGDMFVNRMIAGLPLDYPGLGAMNSFAD
jgi:hypothetical protein